MSFRTPLRRLPGWLLERPAMARRRFEEEECAPYVHVLSSHRSPLERDPGQVPARLQAGKERNVSLAAGCIDRLLVPSCGTFSYHHAVGRTWRLRGFRDGLELRDGAPSRGVGGGCCQIANMLYLLALHAGMKVTERHRHALDLFPDRDRRVPFGCGATVFYNYADLRFENPLPWPVLLRLSVDSGQLIGEVRSAVPPEWEVEIVEADHRFTCEDGVWWRENRILRRFTALDGRLMLEQEVARNRARTLYTPEEAAR